MPHIRIGVGNYGGSALNYVALNPVPGAKAKAVSEG